MKLGSSRKKPRNLNPQKSSLLADGGQLGDINCIPKTVILEMKELKE